MRKIFVSLLFILTIILPTHAQWRTMTNLDAFNDRLAGEATTLQSIESEFIQQKYLDVFDEIIISKGTFYYKKENKIRMDYSKPLDYLIVINNTRLKIVSDGKKSLMNLNSNKMMNQMQDMLTACMVGDLSKLNSNYELSYFEDNRYYRIIIEPVSEAIRDYITEITIDLDKKDMSVYKLRLSETETNYTEYEFYNKKFNSLTDEKLFEVR